MFQLKMITVKAMLAACSMAFFCSATAQFRKYSNEFLNIGAGARGLAMGGAQVASSNDATSGYWNPAGLAVIRDQPAVSFMHAEYFSGIGKYDFASLVIPAKNVNRTLAVSFLRFAVDDIPNTLFLIEPDGNINYNNIRTFSSADYAFLFSYAQKVKDLADEKLYAGANVKIIHRKVGSFATAWGFGLDAGLQYKKGKWQFGLTARDLTSTFNAWSFNFTEQEKEVLYLTNNDIPVKSTEMTAPRLVAGAGYLFRLNSRINLLAEGSLDFTFDGKRNTVISSGFTSVDPHIGVEGSYRNQFFLRMGITNFQRALADSDTLDRKKVWIYQPSLGAGFKTGNVNVDYAFTNLANQSNPLYTHIFSLRVDLVKKEKKN